MTQEIWKYPLNLHMQSQVIEMPALAQVLSAQEQRGVLTLWALVVPEYVQHGGVDTRIFQVIGTGQRIRSQEGTQRKYIATVQMSDGLVWHVFEVVG